MATLVHHKIVAAKKEHRCNYCSNQIIPGQTYDRAFLVDGGQGYTWKTCFRCAFLIDHLIDWNDFDSEEGLDGDGLREYALDYLQEHNLEADYKTALDDAYIHLKTNE